MRGGKSVASLGRQDSLISLASVVRQKSKEIRQQRERSR